MKKKNVKIEQSKDDKVMKNAVYYTFSSIVTLIVSFISVSVLTYILTTEEYGIVNFYTSTISMLTIILSLSVASSISRFYYEKDIKYGEYIKSTCIFIVVLNIILAPLFIIGAPLFSKFLNISEFLYYLILIGSYVSIFVDFYERHLIAAQNAKKHVFIKTIPLIINTIISIILILVLKNTNGGYIRVLTILGINILLLVYIIIQAKKLLKERYNKKLVRNAVWFSIPLVFHSLSNYVLTYFDKLVINQYGNLSNTGIYSLATKVAEVLLLVINSINYSWAPVFYQNNGDYKSVEKVLIKYTQLIFIIALGIMFYAENFAKIIVGSDFYEALSIIPVLCFGYIFVFLYQIYVNYSIYRKKTINITISTIIAAIINIVLNYIFIPKYGYRAAAYTTLTSYVILFILHYLNARIVLKGDVFKLILIKKEFLFLILGVVLYTFTKVLLSNIMVLIGIRTIYMVFIIIKFNIIGLLKNFLLKKTGV